MFLGAFAMEANAACPARIVITRSTTFDSVAQACGINIEALKSVNPRLIANTLQAGMTLIVPPPPLPTPMLGIGRPSVQIMPPLVPPAAGPSLPTVILPPEPSPIPPQHILRGFGDQPGQLPLPPGHSLPLHPPPLFP